MKDKSIKVLEFNKIQEFLKITPVQSCKRYNRRFKTL